MSTGLPWQLRVPSASLADSFGRGPWSSRSTRLWCRHRSRPMRALTRLTHFPRLTGGGFLRNMVNCFLLNRRWWASKYCHELTTQLGKSVCGVHSGWTRGCTRRFLGLSAAKGSLLWQRVTRRLMLNFRCRWLTWTGLSGPGRVRRPPRVPRRCLQGRMMMPPFKLACV